MSIGALICGGIGPGSTIPLLLTGGLGGVSTPAAEEVHGGYPVPRKRRKPEWRERDERESELADEIRDLYERIVEGKRPAKQVVRQIANAVAPFADESKPNALPPTPSIDFQALLENTAALNRFLGILGQTRAAAEAKRLREEAEDMEVIEMLMMSGLV